MSSPLLDLPGAVAGDGIDAPVAAHYGSFNREQRALERGEGFVDLSHRDVVRIDGPGPADLAALADHAVPRGARARRTLDPALVLSPQGHVEHAFIGVDDGEAFTAAHRARRGRGAGRVPRADEVHDARRGHRRDLVATPSRWRPARRRGLRRATSWSRATSSTAYADAAGPACGLWAFEALRIARGEPRFGLDTDHRTIPNEVGWIGTAVHLDKGCYRGQETVARVHTLGRPPRRLTLLHLDGSRTGCRAVGVDLLLGEKSVGFVGSSRPPPRARPDRAGAGQAQRRPGRRSSSSTGCRPPRRSWSTPRSACTCARAALTRRVRARHDGCGSSDVEAAGQGGGTGRACPRRRG